MPLPASFDTLEAIPEAFRSVYVEKDGKYVPDDSDTRGLKDSQKRLLDEKKKSDAELTRFRETLGDAKPEDVAAILKAHRDGEEERQKKAGEFDKLIEKRVNETKAEYEKRLAEALPYKQKYEDRELDIAIRDAAAKAGVISEDMKLVIPIVKGSRIKLDDKTGKPVVYDADGDPTGLSVEKFFAETFKAEAPKFYAPSGGSGGGSNGGSGSRSGSGTVAITDAAGILANVDKIAKGQMSVAVG
jgi:hypothetical protein